MNEETPERAGKGSEPPALPARQGGMSLGARIKVIAATVVLVVVVIVGFQNNQPVTLHFLFWTWTLSRLLLFVLLFAAGIGTGLLLPWLSTWGKPKSA